MRKSRLLGQLAVLAVAAGAGAGCSSHVFDVGEPAFTGSTANQQSIITAQAGSYAPAGGYNAAPAYGSAQGSGVQRAALPPPPGASATPTYSVSPTYSAGAAPAALPPVDGPGTYTPPRPYAAKGLPTPVGPVGTTHVAAMAPAPMAPAAETAAEDVEAAPLPVRRGTPPRTLGQQAAEVDSHAGASGIQMANVNPRAAVPAPLPTAPAGPIVQPQTAVLTPPAAAPGDADAGAGSAQSGDDFRWPVRGRIISAFGKKPSGERNDGIDLAVPEGTSVKAAEDGEVIYSGNELKSYGNLVLIRHANGWVSAYAHNSELKVKRGDKIRRGQIVAVSGMSGGVTTPQVHFELRKDATPVDPVGHLSDG